MSDAERANAWRLAILPIHIKLSPYQAITKIGEALFGEKYSKDMMAIVKAAMPVPSNSKHEQFALAKV